MKQNTLNSTLTTLPILIHSKIASSPWGRPYIELFYKHTQLQKLSAKFMFNWQDAAHLKPSSYLIVIGTDSEWLNEVFMHLTPFCLRIILIDGNISRTYNNINKLLFNQNLFIERSLELLKNHGRRNTAFFGSQKSDTSDETKASTFAQHVSPDDVFYFTNDINSCFDSFLKRLDRYDSVICANDLIAVYLTKRCLENNISIPQQLFLIGNGDLWISSHITPTLSTWSYDREAMVIMAVQICKHFSAPRTSTIDILINPDITERMSTGKMFVLENDENYYQKLYIEDELTFTTNKYNQCPEIQRLKTLNLQFSSCQPEDLIILQSLVDGDSYETISEKSIMSLDAVKYHIKKIYRLLGIHSRKELISLAQEYHIYFA